jgi:hypothetical protein
VRAVRLEAALPWNQLSSDSLIHSQKGRIKRETKNHFT